MSRRRFAVWFVFSCTAFVLMTPVSGAERARSEPRSSTARSIVVSTTPQLLAALASGTDLNIFIQPGTYLLNQAIQVPENTALIGGGEMSFGADGLPTGFVPASRTVLAAAAGVTGDFVTLKNGASLQGLVIQDVVRPAATGGVVVMVKSQGPNDSVSAQILECEIINPNLTGSSPQGPTGRGLTAITRNGDLAGGISHEQSVISVHLTHSIIRSVAQTTNGSDSIFVINHASGSQIELHLRENVLGRLTGNGAVSRPTSTVGATVLIQSTRNLYRADTNPAPAGWVFNGGTDTPLAGLVSGETLNNRLSIHSVDDRITGFERAISATGALRFTALAGAVSSNQVDVILHGTRLASITSDFQLRGASSIPAGVAAGDFNETRVTMRDVTGSGLRTNTYLDAVLGLGNRLVIHGSPHAFSKTNQEISPMPGNEFFTGGNGGPPLQLGPVRFQIKGGGGKK